MSEISFFFLHQFERFKKYLKDDPKDTIRDRNGLNPLLPRAEREERRVRFETMALTYDSANVVFNVSSYSGALLLQAGARKATTAALPQRNVARRGCIMCAVLHNYRVAGKLYDYAHLASINFLSLYLSLEYANFVTGKEKENNPQKWEREERERHQIRRERDRLCPRPSVACYSFVSLPNYLFIFSPHIFSLSRFLPCTIHPQY